MKATAIIVCLCMLLGCTTHTEDQRHDGWFALRWIEKPARHGASHKAKPADRTRFIPVTSFDLQQPADFTNKAAELREGDVIAYWMKKQEATRAVSKGELNKVGYGILSYGHLAILVKDPHNPGKLLLFSSQSLKGPNTDEGIETLCDHSWDAYRLDQWERVNKRRLYEFIAHSKQRAGNWSGYDFSGMFGLWNSNLEPDSPEAIGRDYICSTIVVAALYYSGLKLDAVKRAGLLDLVSPKQVVTSRGCIIPLPDVTIKVEGGKH